MYRPNDDALRHCWREALRTTIQALGVPPPWQLKGPRKEWERRFAREYKLMKSSYLGRIDEYFDIMGMPACPII
jgi:hypothetical protein